MKKGYLLIDGPNLGNAATASQKLTVGEMEVQAIYGFIRVLRPLLTTYSMLTPIVLWDGRTWRSEIYPEYKANRKKEVMTKSDQAAAERRQSFREQLPYIKEACQHLGISQVIAANLEADDLAALLADRYSARGLRVMLISGDKDWIQLVGPRVGWRDPIHDIRITESTIEERLGVKTARAWLEVKALMGDSSDNIPGVGGIGEKGAKELLNTYGSVTEFHNRCMDGTIGPLPKKFADFADDIDKQLAFRRNMDLMDLRSPKVPAPIGLRVTKQPLDREAFADFCRRFMFKSILKDLDGWLEPFREIA